VAMEDPKPRNPNPKPRNPKAASSTAARARRQPPRPQPTGVGEEAWIPLLLSSAFFSLQLPLAVVAQSNKRALDLALNQEGSPFSFCVFFWTRLMKDLAIEPDVPESKN
jgi:hypothetical protein